MGWCEVRWAHGADAPDGRSYTACEAKTRALVASSHMLPHSTRKPGACLAASFLKYPRP